MALFCYRGKAMVTPKPVWVVYPVNGCVVQASSVPVPVPENTVINQ